MSDEEVEVLTQTIGEDNTHSMAEESILRRKRTREANSSDEGWNTVVRGRKVRKQVGNGNSEESVQVSISSKNELPKQFALARLFKENGILGTSRVKYIHKYRMIITFENDTSAELFLKCKTFAELEWKCQKTSEVGISYGMIRNVDLDITNEEMIESISGDFEIISVKRLDRRNDKIDSPGANSWVPSETVRIGFKGSSLPPHVYIYEIKAKVEPYIFPVTQCSRCWKFGHPTKMCPSKSIVCPKCSGKHENCVTTTFQCVNCKGSHMALQKICPVYTKERRVRELMAEFNCTYRKAVTVYVPPTPPHNPTANTSILKSTTGERATVMERPILASIINESCNNNIVQVHNEEHLDVSLSPAQNPIYKSKQKKKKQRPATPGFDWNNVPISSPEPVEDSSSPEGQPQKSPEKQAKDLTLVQLLVKLKNIVLSRESLELKIQNSVVVIMEWIITKVLSNLSVVSLCNSIINNG